MLVDFAGKRDERPDFYVLTVRDWVKLANAEVEKLRDKGREMVIEEQNVSINQSEVVKKTGKFFESLGIAWELVEKHKEKWDKISGYISH